MIMRVFTTAAATIINYNRLIGLAKTTRRGLSISSTIKAAATTDSDDDQSSTTRSPRIQAGSGLQPKEHVEVVKLDNCSMEFRSGHIGRFSDGSVELRINENTILGSVVSKPCEPVAPVYIPFGFRIPLTVDIGQSAAAEYPGRISYKVGYSQSELDVLTSRTIDSSLRPCFHPTYSAPTHVVCKPLAVDDPGDSLVLAINVASAALNVSPVPLFDFVAACRVCVVDGKIIVNPPKELLKRSTMNMVVAANEYGKLMKLKMYDELKRIFDLELFLASVDKAREEIRLVCDAIDRLEQAVGRPKYDFDVSEYTLNEIDEENDCMLRELAERHQDRKAKDITKNIGKYNFMLGDDFEEDYGYNEGTTEAETESGYDDDDETPPENYGEYGSQTWMDRNRELDYNPNNYHKY